MNILIKSIKTLKFFLLISFFIKVNNYQKNTKKTSDFKVILNLTEYIYFNDFITNSNVNCEKLILKQTVQLQFFSR